MKNSEGCKKCMWSTEGKDWMHISILMQALGAFPNPLVSQPRTHKTPQTTNAEDNKLLSQKCSQILEIIVSPLWLRALEFLLVSTKIYVQSTNILSWPKPRNGHTENLNFKYKIARNPLGTCMALIFPIILQTFDSWIYQSELPWRNSENCLPNHNSLQSFHLTHRHQYTTLTFLYHIQTIQKEPYVFRQ